MGADAAAHEHDSPLGRSRPLSRHFMSPLRIADAHVSLPLAER